MSSKKTTKKVTKKSPVKKVPETWVVKDECDFFIESYSKEDPSDADFGSLKNAIHFSSEDEALICCGRLAKEFCVEAVKASEARNTNDLNGCIVHYQSRDWFITNNNAIDSDENEFCYGVGYLLEEVGVGKAFVVYNPNT